MNIPIIKLWDEESQKYIGVPAIKGDKGDPYTLTEADKQEIANSVIEEIDSIVQAAVVEAMKASLPYDIGFDKGEFYAPSDTAYYIPASYTESSVTFNYCGGSGVEELVYPITGLYPGRVYTIVFDETYNGTFIQDTYRYGCGIMQKSTYDATTFPNANAQPSYIQWYTESTGTNGGSITFTAQASTVYWVWNLGRLSDRKDVTITFNARLV